MHEQGSLYELSGEDEEQKDDTAGEEQTKTSPTFEQAFARLEQIVARLEGGEAALEDSLRLFEEGVGLARFCRGQLDRAESRIKVLIDGEEKEEGRQIAASLEHELHGGAKSE